MISSVRHLVRTRLALRSAAVTLLAVAMLGVVSLIASAIVSETREQRRELERLNQLVDTVERTVQIACFLNNRELATEVANGLLSNRIVNRVQVRQNGVALVDSVRTGTAGPSPLRVERPVNSPFATNEELCRITLIPDVAELRATVVDGARFVSLLLSIQLAAIGIVVALVVVRFVTRPIRQVSQRLNVLEAETGQKLLAPIGNERDEIGSLVASVNSMIDRLVSAIATERELRLEREVEERRFRTIVENVETGIFELDSNGRLAGANPAFRRLFGLTDNATNNLESSLLRDLVEDGGLLDSALRALTPASPPAQLELTIERDGRQRWISILLTRIEEHRVQGVASDITERHLAAAAAEQMALTDALTGLGNRRGLDRRLAEAVRCCHGNPDYRATLILLDLDHFKDANDTFGHAVGDIVLQRVGIMLNELVRKGDYAARLGGDEFVILLDSVSERHEVSAIVERFLRSINQPMKIDDAVVRIGVSLGLAVLGQDALNAEELVKMADAAMYEAKHSGRNTFRFTNGRH